MPALAKAKEYGIVQSGYPQWPEARILAEPVKTKQLTQPRLLVERRQDPIYDRHGWELRTEYELSHISFFAGAGGFDIGFEQAGYHTLCQIEWDDGACRTLICNRPEYFRHAALIQADVRQLSTWEVLKAAGVRVGECLVFTGGPPCQGYSTSNGNRGKAHDPRNDLVFEYLRFVREGQPKYFIFENVPGFQSFPGKVDGHTFLDKFLRTAYDSGYELVYGLLNACEYGVPQSRVRFICMGTRKDIAFIDGDMATLPEPTHFNEEDLRVIRLFENSLFQHEVDILRHPPGVRYFPDRPVLITPYPCKFDGKTKKFIEFYKDLMKNEPDRIVRKAAGSEADRYFTVMDAIGDLPPIQAGAR